MPSIQPHDIDPFIPSYHGTTYSQKEKVPQFTRPDGLIGKNPCRNATQLLQRGWEAVICWLSATATLCVSHSPPPCSCRSVTTPAGCIGMDAQKYPQVSGCRNAQKCRQGNHVDTSTPKCSDVCAMQSCPLLLMGDDTLGPDRGWEIRQRRLHQIPRPACSPDKNPSWQSLQPRSSDILHLLKPATSSIPYPSLTHPRFGS